MINQREYLIGRFNSHYANEIRIFVDEGTFGYDRASVSVLKYLITEPTIRLEMKGKDTGVINSFHRLIMVTNENWNASIGLNDRRFFGLEVGTAPLQDYVFFEDLIMKLRMVVKGFKKSSKPT